MSSAALCATPPEDVFTFSNDAWLVVPVKCRNPAILAFVIPFGPRNRCASGSLIDRVGLRVKMSHLARVLGATVGAMVLAFTAHMFRYAPIDNSGEVPFGVCRVWDRWQHRVCVVTLASRKIITNADEIHDVAAQFSASYFSDANADDRATDSEALAEAGFNSSEIEEHERNEALALQSLGVSDIVHARHHTRKTIRRPIPKRVMYDSLPSPRPAASPSQTSPGK